MNNYSNQYSFKCVKCGCKEFVQDVFCVTGTGISRILDIQNKKFVTISCIKCGYTELYRKENMSSTSQIFDAITT